MTDVGCKTSDRRRQVLTSDDVGVGLPLSLQRLKRSAMTL